MSVVELEGNSTERTFQVIVEGVEGRTVEQNSESIRKVPAHLKSLTQRAEEEGLSATTSYSFTFGNMWDQSLSDIGWLGTGAILLLLVVLASSLLFVHIAYYPEAQRDLSVSLVLLIPAQVSEIYFLVWLNDPCKSVNESTYKDCVTSIQEQAATLHNLFIFNVVILAIWWIVSSLTVWHLWTTRCRSKSQGVWVRWQRQQPRCRTRALVFFAVFGPYLLNLTSSRLFGLKSLSAPRCTVWEARNRAWGLVVVLIRQIPLVVIEVWAVVCLGGLAKGSAWIPLSFSLGQVVFSLGFKVHLQRRFIRAKSASHLARSREPGRDHGNGGGSEMTSVQAGPETTREPAKTPSVTVPRNPTQTPDPQLTSNVVFRLSSGVN